jgi:hypothetical protein
VPGKRSAESRTRLSLRAFDNLRRAKFLPALFGCFLAGFRFNSSQIMRAYRRAERDLTAKSRYALRNARRQGHHCDRRFIRWRPGELGVFFSGRLVSSEGLQDSYIPIQRSTSLLSPLRPMAPPERPRGLPLKHHDVARSWNEASIRTQRSLIEHLSFCASAFFNRGPFGTRRALPSSFSIDASPVPPFVNSRSRDDTLVGAS